MEATYYPESEKGELFEASRKKALDMYQSMREYSELLSNSKTLISARSPFA